MTGVTMSNIVAGFHTTGIYPVNRAAVPVLQEDKHHSLAERTSLQFIPLYSPLSSRSDSASAEVVHFTPEEITKFRTWFEEDYDIPDN